ncbi:hypothetical protein HanPSC8_Chr16g0721101 [Helianthus annuus]|nr:hypothetical protein HanPSC8_Chr16g0721101 [Helianthus annuus]
MSTAHVSLCVGNWNVPGAETELLKERLFFGASFKLLRGIGSIFQLSRGFPSK